MSDRQKAELLGRRGELMAELFLQELGAEFVARPSADLGYDFFVGFNNPEGGVNLAAVELKATDRPVHRRFAVQKRLFQRMANSNIPVLLLVANVKENRMFYALPSAHALGVESAANTVSVPVAPVDGTARDEIRELLMVAQTAASQAA